jgi:aromatic-L-amino-acid decarboxylase
VEEFKDAASQHVDWIVDYFRDVRNQPVLPSVTPGEITAKLPHSAPETGEPIQRIFGDFQKTILPGLTLWNHPRYFAYFAISSPPPCILADLLTSVVNVNPMLWKTSPAATELEQVTLSWLRQWLGLPDSFFGITYDTASTAVMHALLAAREWKDPEARTEGMHPGLTVYVSEHTHSSAEKAAIVLGFGQRNVRRIPVDGDFRMGPDLLEQAIESDKAQGKRPCCIVASVGSTSTSAIEPVPAIADIAERHGLWLHVDGAYGAAAAVLPEMRHILNGVERAHSFVINPHKWLYVSVDCSVFYTRYSDVLRRAAELNPEYLRTAQDDRAINFMEYGMQLGRRFRSLKLWYVLRYYGRTGIQSMLRESLRLAQLVKSLVEADPDFELSAPVPLSLVCFRHKAGDTFNRQLLEDINASGKAFLSHTVLNGQFVLRFAVGNFQTTESDIRETWDCIKSLAARNAAAPATCHHA